MSPAAVQPLQHPLSKLDVPKQLHTVQRTLCLSFLPHCVKERDGVVHAA